MHSVSKVHYTEIQLLSWVLLTCIQCKSTLSLFGESSARSFRIILFHFEGQAHNGSILHRNHFEYLILNHMEWILDAFWFNFEYILICNFNLSRNLAHKHNGKCYFQGKTSFLASIDVIITNFCNFWMTTPVQ